MNDRLFREIAVTAMIQQHMPREGTALQGFANSGTGPKMAGPPI
jgi:hypothetical protein